MSDPSGGTSYSYDQHGRVTGKTQQTGHLKLVTRYAYDTAGRLASITYPSGKTVSVTYDAAGEVNGLFNGRSALISGIVYRPFGPAAAWRQGNGTNLIRSFDLDGRIDGITGGGSTLAYGYDAANRVTSFDDTGYPNQSYGYDALDRLTGYAEGTDTTAYGYDADGNRLKLADTDPTLAAAYGIAANSNRLLDDQTGTGSSASTDAFAYDASGNLLEDTVTMTENDHDEWFPNFWQPNKSPQTEKHSLLWTYDARGRMAGVTAEEEMDDNRGHALNHTGRTTEYAINGLGQRVSKSGQDRLGWLDAFGGGTDYAYDEAGHLIGEYDSRGNAIEETVYLGNIPVAVMTGNGMNGLGGIFGNLKGLGFGLFGNLGINGADTYYVTADNIGSPHILTDARNRRIWEWHHAPFGDTEPVSADGFAYNLRFPGQVHDMESDTNYNMMRDYNPALGRYVQSDPIGLLAGVNTYAYVGGNPLTHTDKRGLLGDGMSFISQMSQNLLTANPSGPICQAGNSSWGGYSSNGIIPISDGSVPDVNDLAPDLNDAGKALTTPQDLNGGAFYGGGMVVNGGPGYNPNFYNQLSNPTIQNSNIPTNPVPNAPNPNPR